MRLVSKQTIFSRQLGIEHIYSCTIRIAYTTRLLSVIDRWVEGKLTKIIVYQALSQIDEYKSTYTNTTRLHVEQVP